MALVTFDPGNKDVKKISGNIFTLGLLGGLGLLVWYYLLPILNTIVWGTLELAVGVILGVFVFGLVTNKKFWRFLKYSGEFLAQFLLGWLIEMNPFGILEYRLEKTAQAAQDLLRYDGKLKGKASELREKIADNDSELKEALSKKELLERKISAGKATENDRDQLELTLQTITSNTEYINGIDPVYKDLLRLCDFTQRAYRTASLELEKSKRDLSKKKDLYETVTTASATVSKAWKALLGDEGTNADAEKAIEALKKDIGQKIGAIKTGIKVTSQFMDGKDLENAAKLQTTLKQLQGINLENQTYSSTLTDSSTKIELGSLKGNNKYTEYLKLPSNNK